MLKRCSGYIPQLQTEILHEMFGPCFEYLNKLDFFKSTAIDEKHVLTYYQLSADLHSLF